MKFGEKNRGGRRRRPDKSIDMVRPKENEKEGTFSWFDPEKNKALLTQIQSNIPREPVPMPNSQQFYQVLLELQFFLSALCSTSPELVTLGTGLDIQEIARKAYKKTVDGDAEPKGWLPGLYDPKIKQGLERISPESLRRKLDVYDSPALIPSSLSFAFILKLVAPKQLKWISRGIETDVGAYIQGLDRPGLIACTVAAQLIVLFPQKREEFLRALTPEYINEFKSFLKDSEREALLPEAKLHKKATWAEYQFYQQVLAAGSIDFSPEGAVRLNPPAKPLVTNPGLPSRTMM